MVVVVGQSSSSLLPMHASSGHPSAQVEKGSNTLNTPLPMTYTQGLGWGLAGWLAGWHLGLLLSFRQARWSLEVEVFPGEVWW